MSLKRECDRCKHITNVDSMNDREYREVRILHGATASTSGGASDLFRTFDLCRTCTTGLETWLASNVIRAGE